MKRLVCMFFICFAGLVSVSAQDRVALEDSVVIGGISRSMVDLVMDTDQMKVDDRLIAHWAYAELMKDVSKDHLVVFSDRELCGILEYFRTDACRFFSSETFFVTFIGNISKAMSYELGEGPAFSYSLSDKSYGAGLKPVYESIVESIRSVIDDMLGEDAETIVSARKAGVPPGHIELMKTSAGKVMDNLFNIFRITALDYLTKDELKVVEDFALSQLGYKYFAYIQDVRNNAGLSSEGFIDEFKAGLAGKKIKTAQLKSSVADYISLSRAFPEYFPELLRPYAELVVGENKYQGETRDTRPYGKGRLTDKKGVVYEGDFKNGQRHGVLTVTKPGKQPVTQFWIADKHRKEVPLAKEKKDVLKPPYYDAGIGYGYGNVYDSDTKSRYQGIFIDGQLNGPGKIIEPGCSAEGEFVDGRFVDGVMSWTDNEAQSVRFKGRMTCSLGDGVLEWVSKDGSRKETHTGNFIGGMLDGDGYKKIVDGGDKVEASGTFAYGKQYGEGVYRRNVRYGSGIGETSLYIGGFYADEFHGQGCLSISLTDIPSGSGPLTRCKVLLPEFTTGSVEVVMEGIFDDGYFKEGKITYSDGSWYQGSFSELGLAKGKMLRKYQDGSVYQGDCLDASHHGFGELRSSDGSVFKGYFEYGEPVKENISDVKTLKKENVLRYDQLTYEYNNISSGYGKATLIKPAGVKIMVRTSVSYLKVECIGRFKGDNMIEGKVTMSDGNWLEGVFEDGVLMQGRGKTVDKYRVTYEGDIKNGFPHGNGRCYYNDGTWFEGKFAWGNRMAGTHYSATGEVIKVYE